MHCGCSSSKCQLQIGRILPYFTLKYNKIIVNSCRNSIVATQVIAAVVCHKQDSLMNQITLQAGLDSEFYFLLVICYLKVREPNKKTINRSNSTSLL